MQHLLDFIQEHSLEERVHLAVPGEDGGLELSWRRSPGSDDLWHVRAAGDEGQSELVHFGDLLDHLELRGADMAALERELQAIIQTQVACADIVLREARQVLGHDVVRRVVAAPRTLPREPVRDALTVVEGTGERTAARTGHLKLVR